MDITDIRIRQISEDSKMCAIVSVTFDNVLAVHDIKVIRGHEKLFVAMPSRKDKTGEYKDIVHPINANLRQLLESSILEKYETALVEEEMRKDSNI